MFKHFLAAFAGLMILVSSSHAALLPLVSWNFELDKPFCEVTVDMIRDAAEIRKKMKMELVEEKTNSGTLIIGSKGWSLILDRDVVANVKPGGRVDLEETIQVNRRSIEIKQELSGEDDYFREFKMIMEIVENGDKTQVNTDFWVHLNRNHRHIIVRAIVRSSARRLEKAVRESTGTIIVEEDKDDSASSDE